MKTNNTNPSLSPLIVRTVIALIAIRLIIPLPNLVKIPLLLIAALGPLRSFFRADWNMAKSMMLPVVRWAKGIWLQGKTQASDFDHRMSRFASIFSHIWEMDDEEFREKFHQAAPDANANAKESAPKAQQPSPQPMIFLPSSVCKRPLTPEEAQKQADAWWNTEDEDGNSGADRLAELIDSVSEDPTIHTCLLNEHKELRLPAEALVLKKLIEIFQKNGLAADFTADEEVIISWGQDTDGKEAGMA